MINNLTAMQTETAGLGNMTLTALAGHQDFASAFGVGSGNNFYYFISHTGNAEFEVGIGYMQNSNQLVRQTVLQSSQGQQKINFSAGLKNISNDIPASLQLDKNEADQSYAAFAHTHPISDVAGLQTALDAKAPLVSPTFTGTVTLPAGQVVNNVTLSTAQGTSNFLRGDGTYAAPSTTVADGSITNAKLANANANTVKSNNAASSAAPTDIALSTQTLLGRGDNNINALGLSRSTYIDENNRLRPFAHFGHYGLNTSDGLGASNSGVGANANMPFTLTAAMAENSSGVVAMTTGTTATGAVARTGVTSNSVRSENDRIIIRSKVLFDVAPTLTEDYRTWAGFLQNATPVTTNPTTTTRFCGLYYDRNYTNWQVLSRASSTNTFTDTGVAFAINTWYELEVRMQGGATNGAVNVKSYLNGVLINTVTDFDRTQVFTCAAACLQKIAGTTGRLVYLDYAGGDVYATTNY